MSKVLIIDDEMPIRKLVRSVLKEDGYEIIDAKNGREGLELALEEDPDVIVMDVKMPEMSGLDACRELKKHAKTKDIPVLILTGVEESKKEAVEAGVDDFLNKPFESEELRVRVGSMMKIKGLTDELARTVAYVNEIEKNRKSD